MKTPVWVVKSVVPQENYTLLLTFADGKKRLYNARPLLNKPIFADLKSLPFFLQARVSGDTVIWNDVVAVGDNYYGQCDVSDWKLW